MCGSLWTKHCLQWLLFLLPGRAKRQWFLFIVRIRHITGINADSQPLPQLRKQPLIIQPKSMPKNVGDFKKHHLAYLQPMGFKNIFLYSLRMLSKIFWSFLPLCPPWPPQLIPPQLHTLFLKIFHLSNCMNTYHNQIYIWFVYICIYGHPVGRLLTRASHTATSWRCC